MLYEVLFRKHRTVILRLLAIALCAIPLTGWTSAAQAQNQQLFWLNQQTGDAVAWYMRGPNWTSRYDVLDHNIPLQWQIVANGDFKGDGTRTFIWQNLQTGDVAYWIMNGNVRIATDYVARNIPLEWKIVGAGDFNGDGKPDLVWQNTKTGDAVAWFMNGIVFTGNYAFVAHAVPTRWTIAAVADMNGDGWPDLIFQDPQTGDVVYWLMSGTNYLTGDYVIRNIPSVWRIRGAGDFNGDGKPDLIWQNLQTGDVVTWYMNGPRWTNGWDYLARGIPLEWRVCGVDIGTGSASGTIQ